MSSYTYRVSRPRLKAEIFSKLFVISKKVSNEGRVILREVFLNAIGIFLSARVEDV